LQSAAAIGLAALHLHRHDQEAIMAVLTADHFIENTEKFRLSLEAASVAAEDGHLVSLGIRPTTASTGYGYIMQGESLGTIRSFPVFRVERFAEKPRPDKARQMVVSGNYARNSGMFVWRVGRILEQFQVQMPELFAQLMQVETSINKPDYRSILGKFWSQDKEQTIDYGVMEHARDVVVLPVDSGSTDVGSWASLAELLPADKDGNIFVGRTRKLRPITPWFLVEKDWSPPSNIAAILREAIGEIRQPGPGLVQYPS
jgi:mannose-1-phosphate guanylyltransferase